MLDPTDRTLKFHDRVFAVVRTVPAGSVTTYGDVGSVLGSPRLARQVGWALASLAPDLGATSDVPWHRVINARGSISHRGDIVRAEEQRQRLEAEGVLFDGNGTCDLQTHRWGFPDYKSL
ncbi:MAG TPA: cysteine methyltransferase [Deltaproteobacteria bacterium]|nr:cysteine methyltransferase [Deltaproteobacteria bacterium]HCP44906.1 cysteine methyltransferase [Deltaproteobacteria bacterium]